MPMTKIAPKRNHASRGRNVCRLPPPTAVGDEGAVSSSGIARVYGGSRPSGPQHGSWSGVQRNLSTFVSDPRAQVEPIDAHAPAEAVCAAGNGVRGTTSSQEWVVELLTPCVGDVDGDSSRVSGILRRRS